MIELYIPFNDFHGEINILNLPKRIEVLDFRENLFDNIVWDADILPHRFREGYFFSHRKPNMTYHRLGETDFDYRIKIARSTRGVSVSDDNFMGDLYP